MLTLLAACCIQNATSTLEHLPAQPEPFLGRVSGQLPDSLTHTVVEGGPVGPEVTEPLALLVLDHADPVDQHAAIQNAVSMSEHLPAQPEPFLGGGRGDRISGRGASGTSGSRHDPGQSTYGGDHSPGASGSESVPGQWTHGGDIVFVVIGAVDSSIIVDCTTLQWCYTAEIRKPVITPASSSTLDSRPMEGITYLERPALGVSLDSGSTQGASCPEPLEQSVLDSSLATRPVECVIVNVLDWDPLRNPATSYALDSRFLVRR